MSKIFSLSIILSLAAFGLHAQENPKSGSFARVDSVEILPPSPKPAAKTEDTVLPLMRAPENANLVNEADDMQGPFYFYEEKLESILATLEMLFQKSIIRDSKLQDVKLTFTSRKKLTREESIMALRALLALNGVAIIPIDGKFLKAVPSADVSKQIPEFISGSTLGMPPNQDFYTKLFELEHILADDLQKQIKSSMTNASSSIEVFPKSNSFLITDTLLNLQRIESLVVKLDSSNQDMRFFQIKHATASEIKSRISALKSDRLKDLVLDVDSRTNKLIAIGPKPAMPHVEEIVKELDIESDPILQSEVLYIRHSEAPKLVTVLKEIVSGQQKKNSQNSSSNQETRNRQAALQAQEQPQPAAPAEAGAQPAPQPALPQLPAAIPLASTSENSGIEFSEYIQIVADERSNAIVIYGTPTDIKQIRGIVDKLDIILLQVRIDVIITEVSLSDTQVSGLSTFGISYNAEDTSGFSGNTQTFKLSDTGSPAFAITATENSFSAIFDLASQNQDVKVLSSPTIVTTHNKQAEINVSQSLPIITSSASDLSSITTTRSSVSYKDIGIQLIVTPLVGKNGNIQLDIEQSVDSISGYTTIDGNEQPTISKRRAKSFISAANNEVIVLAGLQQTDTMQLEGGVWLLSDIPVVGEFFKPSKNEAKRRELVIFLRPTVVDSLDSEKAIASKEIDKSLAREELKNFLTQDSFYPNNELEDRYSEFDRNRPYKKIVGDPVKFVTGESRGPAPKGEPEKSSEKWQKEEEEDAQEEAKPKKRSVIPRHRR